jgi:hypothetical protein
MPSEDPTGSLPLLRSLLALAWVVEARDPYTGGHSWRVSQFAMLLAEKAGMARREIARIGIGGFLHDLGKIGVPDAILNKPDKLTDEEYAVIKTHPSIGAGLLAVHPLGPLAHAAAFLHHETPDGNGYPNGYPLERIPVEARIIGLVDAFDAMTSTRPYRKGMPLGKVLSIVEGNLGTQFDRDFGNRLLETGRAGGLDHIIGHTEPGIPLQPCVECGPTITITRRHKDGDTVYCRACTGGYTLRRAGQSITLEDHDFHGTPAQLVEKVDEDLLEDLLGGRFGEALG